MAKRGERESRVLLKRSRSLSAWDPRPHRGENTAAEDGLRNWQDDETERSCRLEGGGLTDNSLVCRCAVLNVRDAAND